MPDTAITFSLAAQENLSAQFSRVVASLSALQTAQASAFGSLQASLDATAAKTASTGNIFSAVFGANFASQITDKAIGAVKDLGEEILKLGTDSVAGAASFEQTQIAFTTMLGGNTAAADTLLSKLQSLANVTPFRFTDEADSARLLLAMGQAADKVLPELVDIDTAVSAIGGGEAAVGNVTQALAKMDSEGKTSAIFLNELTRNGIPAWQMLADEMGMSVQQVRALSTQGAIASSVFDQAFHDYTVKHFGDALQNQSQTWDGLISTAQDFGAQLERTFGSGIIQSLEPILRGAVAAIQDPAVIATLQQWGVLAGQFLGNIVEAGIEIARLAGLPIPDLTAAIADANTGVAQFAGNWAGAATNTETAKDAAKGYRDTIAAISDQQATVDANYTHQIDPLREQVRLLDQAYQIQTATHGLQNAQQKLADDQVASVNRFSSVGYDAFHRLAADQRAVSDAQANLDRDNSKAKIDNSIAGLEKAKKNADEQYDHEKRRYEDLIRAIGDTPIKSPVDWGAFATSSQQNVDEFRAQFRHATSKDLPAQAAADRPNILQNLFGTEQTWANLGTTLGTTVGDSIGTAMGRVDWGTVGANVGTGLLTGIGAALTGLGGKDDLGTAALGRMLIDIGKGDFASAAVDWAKWSVLPVGKNAAGATVLAPPGNQFDTSGLPGSGNRHTPSGGPVPPMPPGGLSGGPGAPTPGAKLAPGGQYWILPNGLTVPVETAPSDSRPPPGRATGGPVQAGGWYTVGEHGPEMLYAGGDGYVQPNGGGQEITIRHLCPECLRSEMLATIRGNGQVVSEALASSMYGRR